MLAVLGLLSIIYCGSLAQYSHPERPSNAEVILALDNNGDAMLSPAELTKCNDCQFRCLCDGLKHALSLSENNPDINGDGKLSEDEIPAPPDNADTHETSSVTNELIFATVDADESGFIIQTELRTCLRRQCHLNCPCKELIKNFTHLAGADNKLQIDELPVPEAPPGHTTTAAPVSTTEAEEEEEEEEDRSGGKRGKKGKKNKKDKKDKGGKKGRSKKWKKKQEKLRKQTEKKLRKNKNKGMTHK